jgi:Domain of unknown function (DUF4389)
MDPPRQSRWTVLFRGILAIPLIFIAAVMTVAAEFVTVIAWFAALFTGRVPESFQEFLTGWLRLYANVLSYMFLLIPRWPGVAFSPKPRDQVTLEIDHVRLNRAAVFFRLILAIPANIVGELLLLGSAPILLVMWLWGTVTGREPRALHQAMALVLRFQTRLQAYITLVSPTQPWHALFGDGLATAESTSSAVPTPPAAPTSFTFGSSIPLPPEVTGTSTPPSDTSSAPTVPTRWFVTKAAKGVVVLMLVLGVPVYVTWFVSERSLVVKFQDVISRTIAASSYTTTVNAMTNFQSAVQTCPTSTYVGCAAKAATTANEQLTIAFNQVRNTGFFPADAQTDATNFDSYLNTLLVELTTVQTSSSAATSMSEVNVQIPNTYNCFKMSYEQLKEKLNG